MGSTAAMWGLSLCGVALLSQSGPSRQRASLAAYTMYVTSTSTAGTENGH